MLSVLRPRAGANIYMLPRIETTSVQNVYCCNVPTVHCGQEGAKWTQKRDGPNGILQKVFCKRVQSLRPLTGIRLAGPAESLCMNF